MSRPIKRYNLLLLKFKKYEFLIGQLTHYFIMLLLSRYSGCCSKAFNTWSPTLIKKHCMRKSLTTCLHQCLFPPGRGVRFMSKSRHARPIFGYVSTSWHLRKYFDNMTVFWESFDWNVLIILRSAIPLQFQILFKYYTLRSNSKVFRSFVASCTNGSRER